MFRYRFKVVPTQNYGVFKRKYISIYLKRKINIFKRRFSYLIWNLPYFNKIVFFHFFSIPQNKTINKVNDKHRLPGSALEICCSSLKLGDIKESPFHMSEEKGFVATAMSVVSKYTV